MKHLLIQRGTGDPDQGWVWTCACLSDGHFGRNLAKARAAFDRHVAEVAA